METHGTPMTDPLPRAVTIGSHATARYVNGQVKGTAPSSHESSVSPRNSNLPDVVIVNGGPPPDKQKTPTPPPQSTTAPPPAKEPSLGGLAPMYNGSLQPSSYASGTQYDRGYTGVTVLPHAQPELRENLVIRRRRCVTADTSHSSVTSSHSYPKLTIVSNFLALPYLTCASSLLPTHLPVVLPKRPKLSLFTLLSALPRPTLGITCSPLMTMSPVKRRTTIQTVEVCVCECGAMGEVTEEWC